MAEPCTSRFLRCCGEGIARCEKPAGHEGMHYYSEVWSDGGFVITEW